MKHTINLTVLASGVLLACTLVAPAQVTLQWDRTLGGGSWDYPAVAIPTDDGGYLLAGASYSSDEFDKSEPNRGSDTDFWMIKVDGNGNKLWDKTLGGNQSDEITSAVSTADGGFLLLGWSNSSASGDKSENNEGGEFSDQRDFWLVKVDATGNKQWDKTFGGTGSENPSKIIAADDGGYLMVGSSTSDISGDKSEDNRGGEDLWIVKLDANFNLLWDKTLGGDQDDSSPQVLATQDGGYLIAGTSYSGATGDKSEPSRGDSDFWIIKLDANGQKLWDKTLGGDSSDYPRSMLVAPDGGYLLAGTSGSKVSGDKSAPNKGSSDYWIIKTDGDGHKLWDKSFGGSDSDGLSSLVSIPEGGYLLGGGSSSNTSGDKREDSRDCSYCSRSDYWIIKVDADFNKLWDKTWGGSESDGLSDVIITSDGSYLLAGTSYSGISGDKISARHADEDLSDFWIVKLQEQAGPIGVVTDFVLMDAKKDQAIQALEDNALLELSKLPRYHLNVSANVQGEVGSVKFKINGKTVRVENEAPFALFGDNNGDFTSGTFEPGKDTLVAIPYPETNAQGTPGAALEISFELVIRNTIADVLKRTYYFSDFVAALNQAGLMSRLVGPGPFTVFAPSDNAFYQLLNEMGVSNVRQIPTDVLKEILKYHIVSGVALRSADFTDGQQLKTLQNEKVTITTGLFTNYVNGERIMGDEFLASNGVIHMIYDRLLIPTSVMTQMMNQPLAASSPALEMMAVADPEVNEVTVKIQGMAGKTLAVTVMDYQGYHPSTQVYRLSDEQQQIMLDLRSYPAGLYILHAQVDQHRQSIKVER